jgi:thiol-disulfide isomerase/thioredoxin
LEGLSIFRFQNPIYMKRFFLLLLLLNAVFAHANTPPLPAPDFTVTTSDGQVKKLYQDYIQQQKVVVIEAFFTTCPPCSAHAPFLQSLYTEMQAAYPGQVEFILLSTLLTDTNIKVAQYKTNKGLTMPGVGKDGGSITALQPYIDGQFGSFQGTPTFFVIAPGSGAVSFDIRGNSPSETMELIQQKIESFFPKECNLQNPFGAALEDVQIKVDAGVFDTNFVANDTYDLSQVAALQNTAYTIKPSKTGHPSGLTTYDLVLISKHILAIEPFSCPWQIKAADVNCTGSVTTFDIVTARKVILGILDSFPCGTWGFIPDSMVVSEGGCQDFVGVQLGDVNAGPCNDSLWTGAEARTSPQKLYFQMYEFYPGETARVDVFLEQDIQLNGLQLALGFDPKLLKINKIESNLLEAFDSESYSVDEHQALISWIRPNGQAVAAGSTLLRLQVTAPKGGPIAELLHLSKQGLAAEAYDTAGKIHPLEPAFQPGSASFSILPNPSAGRFTLRTDLECEQDLVLQILDLQGKIVFEKICTAIKGPNNWEMEIPSKTPGLYFLKANGKAAGKVLVR